MRVDIEEVRVRGANLRPTEVSATRRLMSVQTVHLEGVPTGWRDEFSLQQIVMLQ